MNHDELLKDARELVATKGKYSYSALASMICDLSNLVEQQDRHLAELTAACVTCDEVMTKLIDLDEPLSPKRDGWVPKQWSDLRAVRDKARLAAKLVEPPVAEGQNMPTPPGYSEFRNHAKAVVDAGAKVSEAEALAMIDAEMAEDTPPEYETSDQPELLGDGNRWQELLGIRKQRGELTLIEYQEYKRLKSKGFVDPQCEVIRQLTESEPTPAITDGDRTMLRELRELLVRERTPRGWSQNTGRTWLRLRIEALGRVAESEPARPIKVEMRVVSESHNERTWQARLGKMWHSAASCDDRTFRNTPEKATCLAQHAGDAWLAALSEQLGVPLEAVWKDGE